MNTDIKQHERPFRQVHAASLMVVGFAFIGVLTCAINFAFSVANLRNVLAPAGLGLSSKMARHTNVDAGFSLLVSSKWATFDLPSGNHGDMDIKTWIGSPWDSLHIEVDARGSGMEKIADVVSWGQSKKSNLDGYHTMAIYAYSTPANTGIVEEYSRTIFGLPTRLFWRSDTYNCLSFYALRAGKGYDFSFCAVESIWSVAKPFFFDEIQSIEFLR